MHPPEHIVREIALIHPKARLGWLGQNRVGPDDELNKGKFCLLQYYHWRDAVQTFQGEPWNERGPMFGKRLDPLVWVPVWIGTFTKQQVFGGECVALLKRWIRPMRDRYIESAMEQGKRYKLATDDLTEGMADMMLYKANKSTSAGIQVAKKHMTAYEKALLAGDFMKDRSDLYMPHNVLSKKARPIR